MASNLRILSDLISRCVDDIESSCLARRTTFPSLDEPSTSLSDEARSDPDVIEAISVMVAAAYQLIATARPPSLTLITSGLSYYLAACLRVAVETSVAEIIRESGPNGCHVDQLASAIGTINSGKLSRVLRYLATNHIFREVTPDVYANNALSSVLDSGKSIAILKERSEDKFEGTSGVTAMIGHTSDEDCKGAAYLLETLVDPTTAHAEEPEVSPMMRAFGSSVPVWAWLEQPDNSYRFRRFGMAMVAVNSLQPADAILNGFEWKALSPGSVVVDVGGGIGTVSLALAKAFPHLKLIVQERQAVVDEGIKHATSQLPEAVESGQVKFEVHDFLEAQPVENAAVFILKQIVHDWGDSYATRILRQLRSAATPNTRLIVIDSIVPYACPSDNVSQHIPGSAPRPVPPPLLPNLGHYDAMPYIADLSMLVHFNAQERTLSHMENLLQAVGWKLSRVYRTDSGGQYLPQIEAVPV